MDDLKLSIKSELLDAKRVLDEFINNEESILAIINAAKVLVSAFKAGCKVIACGNGGSHSDATHFSEELTGRYRDDRQPYPSLVISDVGHITCVSNDFGYQYIFSRFIETLGKDGDVLLGITTSGNSENVINAVKQAKKIGMKVILLLGKDGGKLKNKGDVEICVPHFGYADRIQEIHIKVIHIIIGLIEKMMIE